MNDAQQTTVERGVALGSVLAIVISYDRNHSILWALLHSVCSWFYVLYIAVKP